MQRPNTLAPGPTSTTTQLARFQKSTQPQQHIFALGTSRWSGSPKKERDSVNEQAKLGGSDVDRGQSSSVEQGLKMLAPRPTVMPHQPPQQMSANATFQKDVSPKKGTDSGNEQAMPGESDADEYQRLLAEQLNLQEKLKTRLLYDELLGHPPSGGT